MSGPLILSIFPGIDLLGRAFEEEWPECCIVRGPDLIFGGDIRTWHPPAGKFDGVIGGPPCQAFSALARLNRVLGYKPRFGNLIPEFERCVAEAQPQWFLMENVPGAPVPAVLGYKVQAQMLNNRWLGEEQNRKRRFCFGTLDGRPLRVETVALESAKYANAVIGGGGRAPHHRAPGSVGGRASVPGTVTGSDGGASVRMRRCKLPDACCLQGLPEDFLADAPFTAQGKLQAVGNGVPIAMGRAVARAVRAALYAEARTSMSATPEAMSVAAVRPTRPIMRYHGGKFRLASWILSFFPPHKIYCEPYAGAASVLLHKWRSRSEVLNDLDAQVVNVFHVLRDPEISKELRRRVLLTPYSRLEWLRACNREPTCDLVENARCTLLRAWCGFGSTGLARRTATGFRLSVGQNTSPAADWATWPDQVPAFVERLRGVILESRPALELLPQLDKPATLFYVDPPYVQSTRTSMASRRTGRYLHDMNEAAQVELAHALKNLAGMVVLSGYPSGLYDDLYPGWERHECASRADGNRPRTEVVWLNAACAAALEKSRDQQLLWCHRIQHQAVEA